MSGRKSPLKIPPEKRKYVRGLEDQAWSPPRDEPSASGSQPLDSESALESSQSPSNRSSPEPHCPICLGKIDEKAFADGCFHCFCRTCIIEWSKIKPECPVCRQLFSRIIFNVESMTDYEENLVPEQSGRPTSAAIFPWEQVLIDFHHDADSDVVFDEDLDYEEHLPRRNDQGMLQMLFDGSERFYYDCIEHLNHQIEVELLTPGIIVED